MHVALLLAPLNMERLVNARKDCSSYQNNLASGHLGHLQLTLRELNMADVTTCLRRSQMPFPALFSFLQCSLNFPFEAPHNWSTAMPFGASCL
jgi:hypothetical protein